MNLVEGICLSEQCELSLCLRLLLLVQPTFSGHRLLNFVSLVPGFQAYQVVSNSQLLCVFGTRYGTMVDTT